MRGQRLLAVALLPLVLLAGCTKNYYPAPTAPDAPSTPQLPVPVTHTLEYRVESVLGFGQTQAQITYGSTADGTNTVRTVVPWIVAGPMANPSNLFVYLGAVSDGTAEVRVQILVDGRVFREATGYSPSISGTIHL